MGHATYEQTNFLGGEWSKLMQGRSDHPKYRSALNLCYNGFPVEQGAWTRRPGTRLLAPTYKGQSALLRPLYFTQSAPYSVEFTDGAIRFFFGTYPVITTDFQSIANVSTANPAVLTLGAPVLWATDDEIAFIFAEGADTGTGRLLRMRLFLVTPVAEVYPTWSSTTTYGNGSLVLYSGVNYQSLQTGNLNKQPDTNTAFWAPLPAAATRKFSLRDALTGANVDGSVAGQNITSLFFSVFAAKSLRLASPYTSGSWASVRLAQNQEVAIAMNGTVIPQALYLEPNAGSAQAATAAIKPCDFRDGPYLDEVRGSIATLSGLSGALTVTVDFAAWSSTTAYAKGDWVESGSFAYKSLVDNNLNNAVTTTAKWEQHDRGVAVTGPSVDVVGFQSTDIGRVMRFFNTPAPWSAASNYIKGNIVWYNNSAYKAVNGVTAGDVPDSDPLNWSLLPSGQLWTWGKITAVASSNAATVLIMGDPLLYNQPCTIWRLGVYSDTTGYPTAGLFYKGRFWFGGAKPNRFDATEINGVDRDGTVRFAPTLADGTVTDVNAISYTFEAEDQNDIFWFTMDQHGIIAGTAGGEWLISASTLNDPLTPSSIDANRVTRYRCANIEPKRTPMAVVFVQLFKKKVMEFLADVFSGRYTAPHLSETARHLTNDGIAEMAYQEEQTPTLWFRTVLGKLIGACYRRASAFATEAPAFIGWHQHALGHGRALEVVSSGPSNDGAVDALTIVTNDGTYNYVEQLTQMFNEGDSIYNAWFLDGGVVPDQMVEETVGGQLGITFTGLYYLIGKTATVFAGGLDLGEYTVAADGTVHVPYGSGVMPTVIDYTVSGAGKPMWTAAYVAAVLALNLKLRNGGTSFDANTRITTTTVNLNPNGATSKIQSFIPAQGKTGTVTPDWHSGYLWMPTGDQTIVTLMNLVDGTEARHGTIATITGTVGDDISNSRIIAFDLDGNAYIQFGGTNYGPFYKISSGLTLVYRAGASSSLGPPGTNGLPTVRDYAVARANSDWICGYGLNGVTFNSAVDGRFVAGNGSSDPGFMGVNQTAWSIGGFITTGFDLAPGKSLVIQGFLMAPFYLTSQNNVAATEIDIYVVAVTDGPPAGGGVGIDNGSTGKKGKGKKGASDGGVFHNPTTQDPLEFFQFIGPVVPSDVNPHWTVFDSKSGLTVDTSDNSCLFTVGTLNTHFTAWSNATTYSTGQVAVGASGDVYESRVDNNLNHAPDTDTAGQPFPRTGTFWKQVPLHYAIKYGTGKYGSGSTTEPIGVKWVVPLNGAPPLGPFSTRSRVDGGLWGLIVPPGSHFSGTTVYLIDTTTGKFFAGLIGGIYLFTASGHFWDDQSQSFILQCSYDSTIVTPAPAPIPLNSTVTATDNTVWYRLYIGENLPPDPSITSTLTIKPNTYTFVFSSSSSSGTMPCVIGYNYESKGQILRAIDPQQSGTPRGPAFGALRTSKTLAVLLQDTLGIEFGTDFAKMIPSQLRDRESGAQPQPNAPFSGTVRDTLEGRTDFDAMVAWRIQRPYPASVVAIGPNITTEDR